MNMAEFCPRDWFPALKWLVSKDFLDLQVTEQGTVLEFKKEITVTAEDRVAYSPADFRLASAIVKDYCTKNSTGALFTLAIGKALVDGPKLFEPTLDQCLALEKTEIKVPFDFYQQPFPVVFLALPKEYRERVKEKYKKCPLYIVAYKHSHSNLLSVTAWFDHKNVIVNAIAPREYKTIEEALIKNRGQQDKDDDDFKVAELTQRLGLNFCLMMTFLGINVLGPTNPQQYRKHRKQARSLNAAESAKAKRLLDGTVFLCDFAQKITFYDIETKENKEKTEGDGGLRKSPKPHWRRGYFKLQPYGTNFSLRKLLFIKPVLVMMQNFIGNLSQTSVTYQGKSRHAQSK